MSQQRVHIVAFDVPSPPDYGGVIDVYYRAKALKDAGYYVVMHCFEYGRGRTNPTHEIADEVFYYDRKKKLTDALSSVPFIVKSRNSQALLARLQQDNDPIILEGQHCTGFFRELSANNRKVAIRMHNVEWHYYELLSHREPNRSRKTFFRWEAKKLRKHEAELRGATLFCVTTADVEYYQKLGMHPVLTPSLYNDDLQPYQENGGFVLFQGNLTISENIEAVQAILNEWDRKPFAIPLIIAGKDPSQELKDQVASRGVELIANPSNEEMNRLLQTANAHLLISFQPAGLKLKVLMALNTGKPCIATSEILFGTEFPQFCTMWDKTSPLADAIASVREHTPEERQQRLEWMTANGGKGVFLRNVKNWLS